MPDNVISFVCIWSNSMQERTLKFDPDIDCEHVQSLEANDESPAGYYRAMIQQELSYLQEYTKFLRSRQDIQQYALKLTISRGERSFDVVLPLSEQHEFIP